MESTSISSNQAQTCRSTSEEQSCVACVRQTEKETEIKTDEPLSFVQQWKLCDKCLLWVSEISVGPASEKSARSQSSLDTSGSISLITALSLDLIITVTWCFFSFCFSSFSNSFLNTQAFHYILFVCACIDMHDRCVYICLTACFCPGGAAENSVVGVRVAPALWSCYFQLVLYDFGRAHYVAQSCLHTDSAKNPNGG